MFSKMRTAATAVAIAGAVALGGAATASAGTAVVTGGGAIHATAGATRLVVNNAVPLNCASSTVTGTIDNGTYTGAAPLTIPTGNIGIQFDNGATTCVGPAGFFFNVSCTSTAQLAVTGNTVAGVTPGRVENVHCVLSFPAIPCTATVTGTVDGTYNNAGSLTVNGPHAQNLTLSASTCPGIIPNGTARFGAPVSGNPVGTQTLTYSLTSTSTPPVFVRPQVAASGF